MTINLSAALWSTLGLRPESELSAGHQSRVFRAIGKHGNLVVKLVETTSADDHYRDRIELAADLAGAHPAVVGPMAVWPDLVFETEGWLAVCYPFVEGTKPDSADPASAAAIGTALAELHSALANLAPTDATSMLPPVPALRVARPEGLRADRLIHGDFADTNLISTAEGLRIIDFDDCGRGSVDFELGNTLYMMWFDAWNSDDHDRYRRGRQPFLDAYRQTAIEPFDDTLVAEAATARLTALDHWLDDPAEAPTGIRTAPPEWRGRLRTFIDQTRRRPDW